MSRALEAPTTTTRSLVKMCTLLAIFAAMAAIAAVIAISIAVSSRTTVVGATDEGRIIPIISLDKPYVAESRVQAYAEECLRQSFSHDFRNFRQTVSQAQSCYTAQAAELYADAIGPLMADLEKRRMVMTVVIERPPVVVRPYLRGGVYTWDVQARISLVREGTTTRVAPQSFDVLLRISRATIEQSPRGILMSNIELKPA